MITQETRLILSQNTPTTIFFDLDDTLFDHRFSDHAGLRAIQQHVSAFTPIPDDAFVRVGESIMDRLWPPVMVGDMTLDDWYIASFHALFEHYQLEADTAMVQDAAQRCRQTYLQTWRLIDGAIELLEVLHGKVKIGIVTNHLAAEQNPKLDQLNLRKFIDFMVCVDEAGAPKPECPIFEMALQLADAQPQSVVMIGDSWSSDVMGAVAMGIRAVWFNRWERDCPDPQLATEIRSLIPVENVVKVLLNR